MVKSKYKVGDYLKLGVTDFIYFKVVSISDGKYYLKSCSGLGKIIPARIAFVEKDALTFTKATNTEVLLYCPFIP